MLLLAFCSKPHWLFVCKPALNGFCFKLGWLLQCKPAWLLPCKLDWLLILALASLAFCSIGSPACMALNLQALRRLLLHICKPDMYKFFWFALHMFSKAFCGNICFEPCCFVLHYQLLKRRAGKGKSKNNEKHQVYKGPFKKIEATFQKQKAMGYFFLKKHFHFLRL